MTEIIRLTLIATLTLVFVTGHAQKKNKCKSIFDKQLGIQVYNEVDSIAKPYDKDAFDDYLLSKSGQFKNITKKYSVDEMVKISYMVGLDGKMTLIKLLSPIEDKEVENQVKQILSSAPLQRPCKCDTKPVPCSAYLSMRLYPKTN